MEVRSIRGGWYMSSLVLAIEGDRVNTGPRANPRPSWHLLTGEYGPRRGGVAGYTRAVARGLASRGEEVHVWAPPRGEPLVEDHGVIVHPLHRGFDVSALR